MAKQKNITPRRKKILEIFQPDESGFSRTVTREELETAGLVGNNGNFRREIAFDWDYFIWKIERVNPDQPTSKFIAVSMVGVREEDTFSQNIRAEIRALILESTYCNLSLMPVSHKNDKEVDHRYGYKEHPIVVTRDWHYAVLSQHCVSKGWFLKNSFDTSIVVQGSVCWSLRVSRN